MRRRFEEWVRSRVRIVFGDFDEKAIMFQYPPTVADQTRQAKYSAKGARKGLHGHYGLSKNWSHQGVVAGKRCGFSQTLGPAAIARYRALAVAA